MKNINLYLLVILLFFASCSHRNLAYLSDLEGQDVFTDTITNRTEASIQSADLLSIHVTSLNPESNNLFNQGEIASLRSTRDVVNPYSINARAAEPATQGYLVDKDGFVNFPVLGKIKVGGLTIAEAREVLTQNLDQYLKEPIVNVRFLNFTVTVVGEVNRPTTITIPSERINILEALGMAGDMTAFGKRENVLVIREVEGLRTATRLNLNSKDILQSPYFYLQQHDVVYVEPDRKKEIQASTNTRSLSIIAAAASIISVFVARLF